MFGMENLTPEELMILEQMMNSGAIPPGGAAPMQQSAPAPIGVPGFPSTNPSSIESMQAQDVAALKQQQLQALMLAAQDMSGSMMPTGIPNDAMSVEGASAGGLEDGNVMPTRNGLNGLL